MKVGLISDTHGLLRPAVFDAFAGVDLILHAGDIGSTDILDELEAIAPVHAVMGNTDPPDLAARAAPELALDIEGHAVVVVHGDAFGSPNAARLHSAYPDADVIVYGHTHRPRVDVLNDCVIVNPGAAGPARFDLKPSVALLTLVRGMAARVEAVVVG